ncbi:MAG: hypothetical protein Q8K82_12875 [Gemmatimonadaceae bacterium]|nr:hypothetical protein [Gemmatimonadaceae bacterium]
MRQLLLFAVAGVFAFGTRHADLYAQSSRESRVALTLGASSGDFGAVGANVYSFGSTMRLWSAGHFTGRVSGAYARPWSGGGVVCTEGPCDMRRVRDEWRIGTDVRGALGGAGAFFAHVGVGVSWSRVTGVVSSNWADWDIGDRRIPVGLGQIGLGIRSRRAQHSRWLEAGVERQATASNEMVYVRAGFGIL